MHTLLAAATILASVANSSAAGHDSSFVDRASVRRYFSGQPPASSPTMAPWDSVALAGVAQLVPRDGGAGGQAWALEAGSGKVWLLEAAGGVARPATVGGKPLAVPAGSHLLEAGGAGSGRALLLVVAQPSGIKWFDCVGRGAVCRQVHAATAATGAVYAAASTSNGQVWLGTARGLALSAAPGDSPQLLNVSGGDPVLAVATAGDAFVTASTAQTLWRHDLSAGTAWTHIGVGGVIDDNITALSFFSSAVMVAGHPWPSWSLAIGTRHALHVQDANGVVARFSGLQGLPVANITSLTSSASSLWIGTSQGLVEMSTESSAGAVSIEFF